jgi:hypothetical protein
MDVPAPRISWYMGGKQDPSTSGLQIFSGGRQNPATAIRARVLSIIEMTVRI